MLGAKEKDIIKFIDEYYLKKPLKELLILLIDRAMIEENKK